MEGDRIRSSFLQFFQDKEHLIMPSSSLVPAGDPTLLFTSAGMVQFKPFFMGEATPPSRRLTTSQKSFRTTDIDEVGDHKHLTFFEMLGNFSIGDYFKKEAVAMAWEMVTQQFGIPADRIYATIYLDDDEAYHHWLDDIGIPEERIYRYGGKDNWWGPAGLEGPCGPCSELHYDSGPEHGCGPLVEPDILTAAQRNGDPMPTCHPNCDCERFVELWNLVFMQFYQDLDGNRTPLPAPSIDTGMGLERAAAVLQSKRNLYETDLFQSIVERICELTGKEYGAEVETDYAIRVVAEHGRGVSFLISDGVVPGNEGRGYVLRRIIRRAIRYGRRLGLAEPFLTEVASAAIHRFQEAYPELAENRDFILRVIRLEEDRFAQTFERGFAILSDLLDSPRRAPNGAHSISGHETFNLYDTYGFPPELTAEIAREHGLQVDMEGFEREMEKQREQSRAAHVFQGAMEMLPTYENLGVGSVGFVGYTQVQQRSRVAALLVKPEEGAQSSPVGHAVQGQQVEIVLDSTPFYAEAGGQIGDAGTIRGPNGRVHIEDTQVPVAGLIIHHGVVEEGDISLGEEVDASVDPTRRRNAARNHSATHLLHASLRHVLGNHVRQAGSLVAPDRLRFDYSHVAALTHDELLEVQALTNQKVQENLTVTTTESTYTEAVQHGALAFFGDKYGDVVRVVRMGPEDNERGSFSVEVCGGTHVRATGQVGPLFIVSEASVGGGMRRVEAVAGPAAEHLFMERSALLDSLAAKLQTPVADLEARLDSFIEDSEQIRHRLAAFEGEALRREAQLLLDRVADVGGVKVLASRTAASNADAMREMGDFLKARLESSVLVLGGIVEGRPTLVAMVTEDLVARGLHAGNIVKEAAQVMGGGGGGRPNLAQAGGRDPERLDASLQSVPDIVRRGL